MDTAATLLDANRYGQEGYPHDEWTRLRREAPVSVATLVLRVEGSVPALGMTGLLAIYLARFAGDQRAGGEQRRDE